MKKKAKLRKLRSIWSINPVERIKTSKKVYNRKKRDNGVGFLEK